MKMKIMLIVMVLV